MVIVVDLETTGIEPKEYGMIDVGAVDLDNPSSRFDMQCRLRDGAEISERSLEINGYTEAELYDPRKPSLEETMQAFDDWTFTAKTRTLAGMNLGSFDVGYLQDGYERAGIKWDFGIRYLDQHTMAFLLKTRLGMDIPHTKRARWHHLGTSPIMEFVGIPREPSEHKAINGAVWEAEAISRMLYGESRLEEFKKYPVPEYLLIK